MHGYCGGRVMPGTASPGRRAASHAQTPAHIEGGRQRREQCGGCRSPVRSRHIPGAYPAHTRCVPGAYPGRAPGCMPATPAGRPPGRRVGRQASTPAGRPPDGQPNRPPDTQPDTQPDVAFPRRLERTTAGPAPPGGRGGGGRGKGVGGSLMGSLPRITAGAIRAVPRGLRSLRRTYRERAPTCAGGTPPAQKRGGRPRVGDTPAIGPPGYRNRRGADGPSPLKCLTG